MDSHVTFMSDLLAKLIDDFFLVGVELAHLNTLMVFIVIAQEYLVFHDLKAGATFGQDHLVVDSL